MGPHSWGAELMRRCPFTHCTRVIGSEYFSCKPHWFKLNREQQDEINAGYRAWKSGQQSITWLRRLQARIVKEVEGVSA
jgi:hypothetical protein